MSAADSDTPRMTSRMKLVAAFMTAMRIQAIGKPWRNAVEICCRIVYTKYPVCHTAVCRVIGRMTRCRGAPLDIPAEVSWDVEGSALAANVKRCELAAFWDYPPAYSTQTNTRMTQLRRASRMSLNLFHSMLFAVKVSRNTSNCLLHQSCDITCTLVYAIRIYSIRISNLKMKIQLFAAT